VDEDEGVRGAVRLYGAGVFDVAEAGLASFGVGLFRADGDLDDVTEQALADVRGFVARRLRRD